MANLSEDVKYWLNIINTATKGEDVRDAIIRLLEIANTGVGNAYTLNGHPASDFALQSQMDDILPLDNEPKLNGTHPLASGGLYDFFYRNSDENPGLIYALSLLLEDYNADTLTGKIYKLGQIRKDIRDAINTKSKTVDPRDAFDTYADKIRDIAQNPNIELQTINITDNGEFVADEDKGYKTVNVDVSSHLKTKTISKPGTYKAEDDDAYGYKEVEVELSTGSSGSGAALISKTVDASNLPDTPQAVTFKPSDDSEGAVGYSQVTVDVTSKIGPYDEIEIDPWSFEEDTFKASEETPTLYGWSSVTIRVKESTGPFTVEFWKETTKIDTAYDIPSGGSATCSKPVEAPAGKVFAGWSPEPINVTHNMKCYATFRKEEHHGWDSEIALSWEEIGKNGGADIDLGEYKLLYYGGFTYNNIEYPGGALVMMKVAGSNTNVPPDANCTSVFVAVEPLRGRLGTTETYAPLPYYEDSTVSSRVSSQVIDNFQGWPDSDIREFLNSTFIGCIEACNDELHGYSGRIGAYIRQHNTRKYTVAYDSKEAHELVDNAITNDYIWIPSRQELWDYCYHGSPTYIKESAGKSYFVKQSGVTYPPTHSLQLLNSNSFVRSPISGKVSTVNNVSTFELQNYSMTTSGGYKPFISVSKNNNTGEITTANPGFAIHIGFCI